MFLKSSVSTLFASVLTLVVSGCLSVEGEIPDVEVTQKGIEFEGVSLGSLGQDLTISRSIEQELPGLELPEELYSAVSVWQVRMKPASGVTDLSFIKRVYVTMQLPGEAPLDIVEYDAPQGESASELVLKIKKPVEVTALWKAKNVVVNLEVSGELPQNDWSVDLGIRFSGKISYKY